MDPDSWLKIAFLVFFLGLAALASLAEGALNSISRLRFKHLLEEGLSKATAADQLLDRRSVLLSTVLAVKTASSVGATTFALLLALKYFPTRWSIAVTAVLISLVILVLCEIIPKAIAAQDAEKTATYASGPLEVISFVLRPLLATMGSLTNAVVRLLGGRRGATVPLITEDELTMLLDVGEEEGVIEVDEREMIHGIFRMEQTTAREIMVPRIDVAAINVGATVEEAIDLIVSRGYSRIPVYEESMDNILGVLYAKDVLRCMRDGCNTRGIREILRPAHFIPETKHVDDLLHELQQEKVHMAIVVDEYGGTAGLVTIEDLLEEIVGEIQDEYDREEATVERVSEDEAIVDGKLSIGDLDEMFGVKIEDDDFDTVGGFVYNQLGKIPNVGDEVVVDDLTISVLSTVGRRIKKLRIVRAQCRNGNGKTAETSS